MCRAQLQVWRTPEHHIWISVFERHINKEARESTFAYPAIEALALPIVRDKQCISPRFGMILRTIYTN